MSKRRNKQNHGRTVNGNSQKNLYRLLLKADRELSEELDKQLAIVDPAMIIVLWTEYGWRYERITKRMETAAKVWAECREAGPSKSMLNLLEDETGIEMMLDGARSYHEFSYLDGARWDGKMLDAQQTLIMMQNQKQWIATLLIAAILIALHRDERWGFERLGKFSGQIDALRREYGESPEKYAERVYELTGAELKAFRGGKTNA